MAKFSIALYILLLLVSCKFQNTRESNSDNIALNKKNIWTTKYQEINCSLKEDIDIQLNEDLSIHIYPSICKVFDDETFNDHYVILRILGSVKEDVFNLAFGDYKIYDKQKDSIVNVSKFDFYNRVPLILDTLKYKNSEFLKIINTNYSVVRTDSLNQAQINIKYILQFKLR